MDWPLLRDLPEADRHRLLQDAIQRRFQRGEVVFHEGDSGETLYLIRRGRVAVRASTPMGDVATFAMLGPGEFFGEQALMRRRQCRTATIVALEALETLMVRRTTFEQLRRAQPSVERFLTEVLAAQVRRLSIHLLEALFLPADRRIARRLIALAHQYDEGGAATAGGRDARDDAATELGTPIVIPLTQEELASLAGTTRPTVNRVLRELEGRNALRLRRGRIELIDLRAIHQRAA